MFLEDGFIELPAQIVPGVYVVTVKGFAVYVGMSRTLYQRIFASHLIMDTLRAEKIDFSILVTDCATEQAASLLEKSLIKKYQPVFNRSSKSPEFLSFTCRKLKA